MVLSEGEVGVNGGAANGNDGWDDDGVGAVLEVGVDHVKQLVLSVNGAPGAGSSVRGDALAAAVLGGAHGEQTDAFANDHALDSPLGIGKNRLERSGHGLTSLRGHVNGSTEVFSGEGGQLGSVVGVAEDRNDGHAGRAFITRLTGGVGGVTARGLDLQSGLDLSRQHAANEVAFDTGLFAGVGGLGAGHHHDDVNGLQEAATSNQAGAQGAA